VTRLEAERDDPFDAGALLEIAEHRAHAT